MASTHQAAVIPEKGGPLAVASRPTPKSGPHEILIEVKAIALNPVDHYQRDFGMMVPTYPAVVGSDVAGIVTEIGSDVKTSLAVGSRVLAFASGFFQNGSPDHGAFQKLTLAPWEGVIPIPNELSYEHAAMLPLAAYTALTAWVAINIPLDTRHDQSDKQAILIWGASSSVGSVSVQSAKALGFRVYATASTQHHDYIKQLGADAVFDYKSPVVVTQIVNQVKADGVNLHTAHAVVDGALQPILDVLEHVKGDAPAKVVHSPILPEGHPTLANTTIVFNLPDMDTAARNHHLFKVFHEWLAPGLHTGTVVPSPRLQVEHGGLEGLNLALDKLKAGVSCTKIVVPV
jgi:NADPH:quinone reductase-like Zn-dependent oxidoreductase